MKKPVAHEAGTPTQGMQVARSWTKPRLQVQLQPATTLELVGSCEHGAHE